MRDEISEGYKTAMKAGDKRRTATLRAIIAAIKDKDIALRGEGKGPASDAERQPERERCRGALDSATRTDCLSD